MPEGRLRLKAKKTHTHKWFELVAGSLSQVVECVPQISGLSGARLTLLSFITCLKRHQEFEIRISECSS